MTETFAMVVLNAEWIIKQPALQYSNSYPVTSKGLGLGLRPGLRLGHYSIVILVREFSHFL